MCHAVGYGVCEQANMPDGEASEGGTPSSARAKHDKSSSLAMNNLLSNVLVAAWQTTQSVTTGAQLSMHLANTPLARVPQSSASLLVRLCTCA